MTITGKVQKFKMREDSDRAPRAAGCRGGAQRVGTSVRARRVPRAMTVVRSGWIVAGAGRRGVRRDRGRAAAGTPGRSPALRRPCTAHGLTAELPQGWQAATESLTPAPHRPREELAVATFPLRYRETGARTSRAARSTTSARATRSSRCRSAASASPTAQRTSPRAPPISGPSSAAPRKHRPAPPVRSSPTTGSASATAAATSTSWWPSARRRRPRCNSRRGRSSTASPWTPARCRTGGRAGSGLQRADGAAAAALLVLGQPVARPRLELGQRRLQLVAHGREPVGHLDRRARTRRGGRRRRGSRAPSCARRAGGR